MREREREGGIDEEEVEERERSMKDEEEVAKREGNERRIW